MSKVHCIGITDHPRMGKEMVAKLNDTPMIIITFDRYLMPWNSDTYDINTANGPHILNNAQVTQRKLINALGFH